MMYCVFFLYLLRNPQASTHLINTPPKLTDPKHLYPQLCP